jgi:hypothetical protein
MALLAKSVLHRPVQVQLPTNSELKPLDWSICKSLILLTPKWGACGLRPVPEREECREKWPEEREPGTEPARWCGGRGPQVSARTRKNTGQHARSPKKKPQLRRVGVLDMVELGGFEPPSTSLLRTVLHV